MEKGSGMQDLSNHVKYLQDKLAYALNNRPDLSPQLRRKLQDIVQFKYSGDTDSFARKISNAFTRILLELIQAHYNTKQREQQVKRLLTDKGCFIEDPKLIDAVINIVAELYRAADKCAEVSYKRKVLNEYLQQQLGRDVKSKAEKVVQTLYKCNCFDIIPGVDEPSRLKLKDGLNDAWNLRQQYDRGVIDMAQENLIRLSPQSWAYLLYNRSDQDCLSRVQAILNGSQKQPTVSELMISVAKHNDMYHIYNRYANLLQQIEALIENVNCKQQEQQVESSTLESLIMKFAHLDELFTIRQRRR